ncbi:25607_t:CDS:2, partial [Racocetra persica]
EPNDDYNVDGEAFEGGFLKWGFELDNKSVKLTVIDYNPRKKQWNPDDKKKSLDILPSFYPSGKNFILRCGVLENDDFITVTRIGVFIWTYKTSEIKMHYYWNYWNYRLEQFEFEMTKFKKFFDDWTLGRILPASSYETIYRNLDVKFGKEEIQLFKKFLEDNIVDEFYLTCYGKILMETFIELKDDQWIRSLGGSCIDKYIQEDNHLMSKISLLSIIFENFDELSDNHPAFIASTLAMIGFVVPSNEVITHSTSSHISGYGTYCHLSKTSFIDIFISNLWVLWSSFQKRFQIWFKNFQEKHTFFRDFIIKPIIMRIIKPIIMRIIKPIINFYSVSYSTTILAVPLPNFVSYPKDYEFWKELLLPRFILVAFAHSLHILLRPAHDVSLESPSYSTDPNDPWNLATHYNAIESNGTIEENAALIDPPTTTTNMFMMMSTAISAVYIMLTGDSTPISNWDLDSNPALLILTILFSFGATIYLMNLFIGVLGNEISETQTWESFYECHTIKLREHIIDIQNNKWSGYKKPFFSKALNEVLSLPEEEPTLTEVEKSIEKKIEKTIKELKELKDSETLRLTELALELF